MDRAGSDILVVKFGGVDSFVHALPAMAALRRAHRADRITLVTESTLAGLAADSPYVDEVIAEDSFFEGRGQKRVAAQLRGRRFAMVFDLEGGPRSDKIYSGLRAFAVSFVSTHRSARHPVNPRALDDLHPIDAALARVEAAGIAPASDPIPDVRWAVTSRRAAPSLRPAYFGLQNPYVMLCPDAPSDQPGLHWPIAHFAGMAARLLRTGVSVAVASGPEDRGAARAIASACPGVRDVSSRGDYTQLAALAASAAGSFGHAGGALMPLLAAAGAPTLVMVTSGADAGRGVRGKSVISMLAPTPDALSADYAAQAVGMFTRAQRMRVGLSA